MEINPELKMNKAALIIFDLLGKPVKDYELNSNHSIIINNENLKKGLYIFKLIDEGKPLGCGKICIN